jgi:hypothetical protein
MPRKTLAQADPRVVGGRYLNGYWCQEYTVTATESRAGILWLTCQWHAWAPDSHPRASRQWSDPEEMYVITTHCTAWDSRRDVIISQPA